jgi:hypothetical protein
MAVLEACSWCARESSSVSSSLHFCTPGQGSACDSLSEVTKRHQAHVGNALQQSTFFKAGLSGDGPCGMPLSHKELAAALSFSSSDIADQDSTGITDSRQFAQLEAQTQHFERAGELSSSNADPRKPALL